MSNNQHGLLRKRVAGKELSSPPVPGQEFSWVSHLGIFHNYKFSSQGTERRAQFQGTVSQRQHTRTGTPHNF